MNLEGKIIGNRYEILTKIGCGGMATVYKARDSVLNRNVAIKVLREEFTTDDEFIKRFNIEAQAAASLTHPNIVSIYDVGNEGDLHYIVMELIQGKTLKEIISENGVLPWKWSVNISIQIASALEMAHRNNIVHRDIKPHNIIITEDGIAKVTDFGIAKAVSNSTITAFGTTIGSVHYFSPEHARGGYTDAKSDLYSLGVVMYEMMTGRVPFDADTPVSIALKHMQEEPVEPIKLNSTIPQVVNNIIMKAMQKDVNLRYPSATEMLRDLRDALKDPNGDFVHIEKMNNDSPTQRIDLNENNMGNNKKKGKIREYFAKHKAAKVFAILLSCILIFAIAMAGTVFFVNKNRPNQVQIPDLVNDNIEDAKKELDSLNLKYEITEEYNSEKEAGIIISQDPKYQDNYKINDTEVMKLVVSKGSEMTKVPKVVGETEEDATTMIKNAKLNIEVSEEKSEKVEEGIIIRQEPSANEEVEAGSTVKVYVSIGRGIKQVEMINVVGQDESNAKKALEDLGFKVNITYTETSSDNGKVTKQSIESGKEVDEGTTVTLTVNKVIATKSVTVSINVKKITNYNPDNDENTTGSSSSDKVNIRVNDERRTGISKNISNYSDITLTGKEGETKEIKVVITDSKTGEEIYGSTKNFTFGSQDTITFE